MKNKISFLVIIVLMCIPALSKEQVTLGASQINITPEEPVMMSGYDARKTPSMGVHDSLFASALFFSSPQNKALLVTADVIGFPQAFVDTVKQMISAKTGIAPGNIILVALHNHGGPAIHAYEKELPQANED